MRRIVTFTIAVLVLLAPPLALAETDHEAHRGGAAHEEIVDGVKATFRLVHLADELKARGLKPPPGLKETHHLAVEFREARTGQLLSTGSVRVRIQGPGKAMLDKTLDGMDGHFGTDVEFARSGKYGITCQFKVGDGKGRQARFWYEVR